MFLKKTTWPQEHPLVTIIMTPIKKKMVSQFKDISKKSHSTLTRGEGGVCLTVFVEGCRFNIKGI